MAVELPAPMLAAHQLGDGKAAELVLPKPQTQCLLDLKEIFSGLQFTQYIYIYEIRICTRVTHQP